MSFIIALRVCNIVKNTDEHGVRCNVHAGPRFRRNIMFLCVSLCPDRENFHCDEVSAEASKILASILEAFTVHVVPESMREAMAGDFGRLVCRMLRAERYAKCRKLQAIAMIFIFSTSPMISRLSSRPPEPTSARVIEMLERCQLIPSGSEEETCTICLAEIPAGSVITRLLCRHFFHDECIVPWLRINRVCPLCGSVDTPNLSGLGLIGTLGYQLSSLTSVTNFDMSKNNLHGDIPYQLPPNAVHINLSGNAFTGGVPYSISQMTDIKYLNVASNQLNGQLTD